MSTVSKVENQAQTASSRILSLLDDLPYLYPTVPLPPSSLDGLVGIMPRVGGDALADTESLYDEV